MISFLPKNRTDLADSEVSIVRDIISETTGILIPPSKSFELRTKLNPHLATLDATARTGFIERLKTDAGYRQQIINLITIGESYFYRNHPHFEALELHILPTLIKANARTRQLRIWSAGCSTGEEPYSLAILMDRSFPELADWNVLIRATDINTAFLQKARNGIYTSWSFRGVPDDIRSRYFTAEGPNRFSISDRIRNRVRFEAFNLANPPFHLPQDDLFDLILCRNVLIYFSHDLGTRITMSMGESLKRGGYLMLGHSESFPALSNLDTIYSHATFYYQRPLKDKAEEPEGRHSFSLIPGIVPDLPAHFYSEYLHSHAHSKPETPLTLSSKASAQTGRDDTVSLIQQAEELSIMGELDDAEQILQDLTRRSSRPNHRVSFLRAVIADQRNDAEGSLQHLKQAIFLNRDFTIAHYYQGVISERENDRNTAKRSYRNVMDLTARMRPDRTVDDGSGITAGRLAEIATERLKELEF